MCGVKGKGLTVLVLAPDNDAEWSHLQVPRATLLLPLAVWGRRARRRMCEQLVRLVEHDVCSTQFGATGGGPRFAHRDDYTQRGVPTIAYT